MRTDAMRVILKRDGKVIVDHADTGWRWHKTSGFHPEFVLTDDRGRASVKHYRRQNFVLKVLDFHNGCGEFA